MTSIIGQLEIIAPIALGGQSSLYLARMADGLVALKSFHHNTDQAHEFQYLRTFRHANIVALRGIYQNTFLNGLVIDYAGPFNLRMLLNSLADRSTFLDLRVVDYCATLLSSVLAYIHGFGIYHNDLSPSNIVLNDTGFLRLVDFGAASHRDQRRAGKPFGKKEYMAPELLLGKRPGPSSDLYSLGVIIFELATGEVWDLDKPKMSFSLLRDRYCHKRPDLFYWLIDCLAFSPALRPSSVPRLFIDAHYASRTQAGLAHALDQIPKRKA